MPVKPTHGSGEQYPDWANCFLRQGMERRGPESSLGGPGGGGDYVQGLYIRLKQGHRLPSLT